MPFYEYECKTCGKRFEEVRTVEQRNGVVCIECGCPTQLLISQSTFIMKDYYDPSVGHITGPAQEKRRFKELGLVQIDEPADEIKLPKQKSPYDTPEFTEKFMRTYEEKVCHSK